jgi:hypothetical protein
VGIEANRFNRRPEGGGSLTWRLHIRRVTSQPSWPDLFIQTFGTSSRRPERAAHAADQGVTAAPSELGRGGHTNAHRLACRAELTGRRQSNGLVNDGHKARQPTGTANAARAAISRPRRGRSARDRLSGGCGYCTLGGGALAPGWPRIPSPSSRQSQADPPAAACSHGGRVDGDGVTAGPPRERFPRKDSDVIKNSVKLALHGGLRRFVTSPIIGKLCQGELKDKLLERQEMDQERSESGQDPDQSTPHENDVSGPSKIQVAIVVAVGTLASFLGLTSFSSTVSANHSAGDRLTDGIFLLIWCLIALTSYFAWEVGSFSELKRRGLPGIANQLFETASIALHRVGKLLTSAGGIAAVLVVLSSITADPIPGEKGIAIFCTCHTIRRLSPTVQHEPDAVDCT